MATLASIDDVKTFVNITTDGDDELLNSLITAESAFILSWIGRSFETQSYTDLFGGNGGTEHVFRSYPVVSVSSLTIDGVSVPEAATIQDSGYMVYDNRLLLFGYQFAWGSWNCQLIYTAGQTVPEDVRQACVELVGYRYKNRERIGLASKGIAGETTAYMTKDMPDHVRSLLNRHRKVFFA
ncbi:MAG: head-tail connector protein [Chlorobiaceae bacterium]